MYLKMDSLRDKVSFIRYIRSQI